MASKEPNEKTYKNKNKRPLGKSRMTKMFTLFPLLPEVLLKLSHSMETLCTVQ